MVWPSLTLRGHPLTPCGQFGVDMGIGMVSCIRLAVKKMLLTLSCQTMVVVEKVAISVIQRQKGVVQMDLRAWACRSDLRVWVCRSDLHAGEYK